MGVSLNRAVSRVLHSPTGRSHLRRRHYCGSLIVLQALISKDLESRRLRESSTAEFPTRCCFQGTTNGWFGVGEATVAVVYFDEVRSGAIEACIVKKKNMYS